MDVEKLERAPKTGPQMQDGWVKDAVPQKEGLYGLREGPKDKDPAIVKVETDALGDFVVLLHHSDEWIALEDGWPGYEWWGPIEFPK